MGSHVDNHVCVSAYNVVFCTLDGCDKLQGHYTSVPPTYIQTHMCPKTQLLDSCFVMYFWMLTSHTRSATCQSGSTLSLCVCMCVPHIFILHIREPGAHSAVLRVYTSNSCLSCGYYSNIVFYMEWQKRIKLKHKNCVCVWVCTCFGDIGRLGLVSECLYSCVCDKRNVIITPSFRGNPPTLFPSLGGDDNWFSLLRQSAAISANGPSYCVFTSCIRWLQDIKRFHHSSHHWKYWQAKTIHPLTTDGSVPGFWIKDATFNMLVQWVRV